MFECVIAEDEELLRTSLLLQLQEAWPELRVVAECEDGASALEAIAAHKPDVAFLDIRMPGLDGISATAAVREASPGTKVLIVTTFGRPGYLRRALQAGASGFVVKDTPASQLADAVRRINQGLRVVDPALGEPAPRVAAREQ